MRPWGPRLALPLALAALAGCVQLSQPSPTFRDYDLNYPLPALTLSPLDVVVSIPPLAINATYDREAIVYRIGPNQVGRFAYDRWATNPGNMAADLIARDFARSGVYRAVVHQRAMVPADYELSGEIEAFEEKHDGSGCTASFSARFLLTSKKTSSRESVLLRLPIEVSEPTPCNRPVELVAAMSKALAAVSVELQQKVHQAISADPEQP